MFSRHDLVWLTPQGWNDALAAAPPAERAALERWQRGDFPAIVRRRDAGTPESVVSVGVALPPVPETGAKPRLGLRVPAAAIARHSRPISIAELAPAAPPKWRSALDALARNAEGFDLTAYGSLALQALTGLAYLTERSDVDVLLRPSTIPELEAGVALLCAANSDLPLDGEIMFPNGDAVAWKEWRDAATDAKLLVKNMSAIRLAGRSELVQTLGAA